MQTYNIKNTLKYQDKILINNLKLQIYYNSILKIFLNA